MWHICRPYDLREALRFWGGNSNSNAMLRELPGVESYGGLFGWVQP